MVRQPIARIEIDKARGKFVDHCPTGRKMCHLEYGSEAPDKSGRHPARQSCHDKEERQQVYEPQRTEWLDEGFKIKISRVAPICFGGKGGCLETELDRHPKHVEVSEMDNLAVDKGSPVAIDHQ